MDGDGFDDLLASSDRWDAAELNEGNAWLFLGSGEGLSSSAAWSVAGGGYELKCDGVVGGGDLDGDGYDDVVVTCASPPRGRAQIFYGGSGGLSASADATVGGPIGSSLFGSTLTFLADVDDDGDDELALGTPLYDYAYTDEGGVMVYLGDPGGISGEPDVTFTGLATEYELGTLLAAGDIDGDGASELLMSTYTTTAYVRVVDFGDADGDGSVTWVDCDDDDATIHTGATEACDGRDNDCNGEIDEVTPTWYVDADGDGYGDPSSEIVDCTQPDGTVANASDCDDSAAAISPDATEACDAVDNDCDGSADESGATGETTFYVDADGDGHGLESGTIEACSVPAGYATAADDCDDTSAAIGPDAVELCNGGDDDCDGSTDEGAVDMSEWYTDADGDGYGDATAATLACGAPTGTVSDASDCDDGDSAENPAAVERCDGDDDDCDGTIDESDAVDTTTFYVDADDDGYGGGTAVTACALPTGHTTTSTDCDDADPAISPGASEACNTADDDCDGSIDEGFATTRWYADADGDRHGDATAAVDACAEPAGYVETDDDCDDADADAHPGADEIWYNGVDESCDAGSDYDADGDGQDSTSYDGDDCDDTDPAVYTGAPDDPYDGAVTDCGSTFEYDADQDGHPAGAYGGDDCDDTNPFTYPGASDTWYDGVDSNCDGASDYDRDGDGENAAAYDGTDCDDADPSVQACASEDDDPADEDGGTCGCDSADRGALPLLATMLAALGMRRRGGHRRLRVN